MVADELGVLQLQVEGYIAWQRLCVACKAEKLCKPPQSQVLRTCKAWVALEGDACIQGGPIGSVRDACEHLRQLILQSRAVQGCMRGFTAACEA